MKKICILLMCIFSVFLLAGCEPSEEVKNDLFIAMRKEDIISDNFTQIDSVSYSRWSLEMCKTDKYYIYKDNKSNMIAIKYEKLIGSNEEYDNLVTIYYDVKLKDSTKYKLLDNRENQIECSDDGYYYYSNGEYTDENKYNFGDSKSYCERKTGLIFKRHVFNDCK